MFRESLKTFKRLASNSGKGIKSRGWSLRFSGLRICGNSSQAGLCLFCTSKWLWRLIWKFQPRWGVPCRPLTVQYIFWREKTAVGEPGRAGRGHRATHRSLTLEMADVPGGAVLPPTLSPLPVACAACGGNVCSVNGRCYVLRVVQEPDYTACLPNPPSGPGRNRQMLQIRPTFSPRRESTVKHWPARHCV